MAAREALRLHRAKLRLVKAVDRSGVPRLGQRFARQRHEGRAARLALHDGMGAAQRLFDHHAAGQVVFPLHIRAHQAGHVKRVLHKMHVVVARARQLAVQRVWRLARHQQHRQAAAKQVVHAHRGIGRARVHMHQHRLAAPGHGGIGARHVDRDVLVRAKNGRRVAPPGLLPACHLFDDRRVVGAQVAKQVLNAQLDQAFEEIVGCGVGGHCGLVVRVGKVWGTLGA